MERCRARTAHLAKRCTTRRSALLLERLRPSAKLSPRRATVANSSCKEGKVRSPRIFSKNSRYETGSEALTMGRPP
jgi:hypothetical protein